jgi:hypothetical protein
MAVCIFKKLSEKKMDELLAWARQFFLRQVYSTHDSQLAALWIS